MNLRKGVLAYVQSSVRQSVPPDMKEKLRAFHSARRFLRSISTEMHSDSDMWDFDAHIMHMTLFGSLF